MKSKPSKTGAGERVAERSPRRPFDREAGVVVAKDLFHERGYDAVGVAELTRALGINPPSLYAAYGNKLSMYLAALEVFGQRMATEAVGALATGPNLHAGLRNFYEAALDIYLGKDGEMAQGCLVFTTAVTEATTEPEIKTMLQAQLAGMDEAVKALIAVRVPSADPTTIAAAAELASGTLLNLATRARAGTPRTVLSGIAKQQPTPSRH